VPYINRLAGLLTEQNYIFSAFRLQRWTEAACCDWLWCCSCCCCERWPTLDIYWCQVL